MAKLSEWAAFPRTEVSAEVVERYEALKRIPAVVDCGEDALPEMVYTVRLRPDKTVVVTHPNGSDEFFDGFNLSATQELDKKYAPDGKCESILPTGERTLVLVCARRRVF